MVEGSISYPEITQKTQGFRIVFDDVHGIYRFFEATSAMQKEASPKGPETLEQAVVRVSKSKDELSKHLDEYTRRFPIDEVRYMRKDPVLKDIYISIRSSYGVNTGYPSVDFGMTLRSSGPLFPQGFWGSGKQICLDMAGHGFDCESEAYTEYGMDLEDVVIHSGHADVSDLQLMFTKQRIAPYFNRLEYEDGHIRLDPETFPKHLRFFQTTASNLLDCLYRINNLKPPDVVMTLSAPTFS